MKDIMETFSFEMRPEGFRPVMGQWKIFSEEEADLAKAADLSFEKKEQYVAFYKENDPEYYEKGLTFIEAVLNRFGRENLPEEEHHVLVTDMIYSLHRFGISFEEYFWYDFPKLSTEGRQEYISDKVRYYLYNRLNLQENHHIFRNKADAYKAFGEYYGREVIKVESAADFPRFAEFVQAHPDFILKPIDGDCGKNTGIYHRKDYPDAGELFRAIQTDSPPVVLEELIVQSESVARFHPKSVNTVRIPVVKSKTSGQVHIITPFFRMGRGDSVVDNAGAGGIFANIDVDTGIVYTSGITENGKAYLIHPDSGYTIIGFQIPRWDEAIALVKQASQKTTNRFIGWDLALTDNGWVIVEANDCGQFVMQLADKKGQLREML